MSLHGKDICDHEKDHLRKSITTNVQQEEEEHNHVHMDKLKKDLVDNKIVDINFAFNNHKLINLLSQRGAAIQKKDWP